MLAFHNEKKINPDELIESAIRRGLIRVNSQTGDVYSARFGDKKIGCINKKGYLVATLHLDGERKQIKLHRAIWIAANGRIPEELVIDHINGIKNDNRIENLRLADAKLNSQNRRSYKGGENPASKIDGEIADKIRRMHKELKSYSKVSAVFNVSRSLVAQIVRRELWA